MHHKVNQVKLSPGLAESYASQAPARRLYESPTTAALTVTHSRLSDTTEQHD